MPWLYLPCGTRTAVNRPHSDVDVIAEIIQAFDGYRAKRFRAFHGRSTLRATPVTNGKPTARAKREANERDVRIHGGDDLLRLLAAYPCSRRGYRKCK